MERIGVYICECNSNIKEALDIGTLIDFARELDHVARAESFGVLCSSDGGTLIADDIRAQKLTRVVIAACSPKEHEITFRKVMKEAGLNPFMMQVANIREQCAWVTEDRGLATEKAKAIIHAAVKRVVLHIPQEVKEIECKPDVLVVGAGIAGISAALTLSQQTRRIYVVEKLPWIGGKAILYEDLYPSLQCAPCVFDPLMDKVLHDDNISVITFSEVEEVLGYYGNFTVRVRKKARYVNPDTCLGCELCFEACPVEVPNEFNEGLSKRKAIYIPYAGAVPNVGVIDRKHCLHFVDKNCSACLNVCPFECINYDDTDHIVELNVGAIVLATGFNVFNPQKAPQYGYGRVKQVYTSLEFERMMSSTGPTGGKITIQNSRHSQTIVLIHCVGSRTNRFNEYCSGICCSYSAKFAHQIRQKLPDASIHMVYSDLCLPGKEAQRFFKSITRKNSVQLHHMKTPDAVQIDENEDRISVRYRDVSGKQQRIDADMAVLAVAIEHCQDADRLAEIFDIPRDKNGFFSEEDVTLNSVSTVRKGVFIAGCAHGPMDISAAASQGQAVAGKILSQLVPGTKLKIETLIAEVDPDICSGCRVCADMCHYKAITAGDEKPSVEINPLLCRGCGTCAAACPSGAITARHFTDSQIYAEINGLTEIKPDENTKCQSE